mgnify:CR=1 FL=1
MKILHVVLSMAVVVFGVGALQDAAHGQGHDVTVSPDYIKKVKRCGKQFREESETLRTLTECVTEATKAEIAVREASYPYYSFERVYSANKAGGDDSSRAEDDCVERLVSQVCKRNNKCVKKVYAVCGALADDIQSSQPGVGEDGIYYTRWQFK